MRYQGKIEDFEPSRDSGLTEDQLNAAGIFLFLKQEADPRFKEKLGDQWKDFEGATADVRTLRLIHAPAEQESDKVLLHSLSEIDELRLAPDGRALAFVTHSSEGGSGTRGRTLSVLSLEANSTPVRVAEGVATFPDWSPDGRDLVFVRSDGVLARQTIRDERGEIVRELPEATDLAHVLFRQNLKVRCLRNGRVLFAANEVWLPAVTNDVPARMTLFEVDPAGQGRVKRVLARSLDEALPDLAELFELSPDQERVAIPGSKGRVSVVTLASGELATVVRADSKYGLRAAPVWRNNEQLSLVAPAGSDPVSTKRDEVVLWSAGKLIAISKDWPDSVIPVLK